nr:hypothetical protein [Candidatus Sigynarchaeota archaeon]
MKPPECIICGKDDDSTLVSFKMRASDEAWKNRMKEIHGTGHPPWQEWFCHEHAVIALKFSSLARDEAMKKIRDELKQQTCTNHKEHEQ